MLDEEKHLALIIGNVAYSSSLIFGKRYNMAHRNNFVLHIVHTVKHWSVSIPVMLMCFIFQRIMDIDAGAEQHEILYVDEAGFNLCKRRRRGWNIIGQRATVGVPGQRGANITMCAAISRNGVEARDPLLGAYNSVRLINFLDGLYNRLVQPNAQMVFIIVWDNVNFHHALTVRDWFTAHPEFRSLFLPPYSPFLNPIEEFFSAWRWKVYDRRPYEQATLLQAMDEACNDITAQQCQGWIRHSRRFYQRCLANEDIRCDVDEMLWPNAAERQDAA